MNQIEGKQLLAEVGGQGEEPGGPEPQLTEEKVLDDGAGPVQEGVKPVGVAGDDVRGDDGEFGAVNAEMVNKIAKELKVGDAGVDGAAVGVGEDVMREGVMVKREVRGEEVEEEVEKGVDKPAQESRTEKEPVDITGGGDKVTARELKALRN